MERAGTSAQYVAGWVAVAFCTVITGFWAFWGILENFHEGWWAPTLGGRLLGTVAYLGPMLICMALALTSIRWPKAGATAYIAIGALFSYWVLSSRQGRVDPITLLTWLPTTGLLVGVGLLFLYGRAEPRRWALRIAAGVPLLIVVACGAEPAWRVAHRVDDGFRGERLVAGDGIRLVWAPEGPGWVRRALDACSWEEAARRCDYLSADGRTLAATPQHVWRLPTVEEAVASMARHGRNAGGRWDPDRKRPTYRVRPDKESPLWDTRSETIYWWTATRADDKRAYWIVYDGQVYAKPTSFRMGSQGFRAVRAP